MVLRNHRVLPEWNTALILKRWRVTRYVLKRLFRWRQTEKHKQKERRSHTSITSIKHRWHHVKKSKMFYWNKGENIQILILHQPAGSFTWFNDEAQIKQLLFEKVSTRPNHHQYNSSIVGGFCNFIFQWCPRINLTDTDIIMPDIAIWFYVIIITLIVLINP